MGRFLDEPQKTYKGRFLDEDVQPQKSSFLENLSNEANSIGREFVEAHRNPINHDINVIKGLGNLAIGEAGQFSRATGMLPRGIPQTPQEDMAENFNKETFETLRHPIKSFHEKPIGTTLDVASIAAPFAGTIGRSASRIPEFVAVNLEKSAASKIGKAQELAIKVLKPENLDVAINKGQLPPSITEGTKAITKVKDYKQLRDVFESAKKKPMEARQKIYDTTKAPIEPTQLDPGVEYLGEQIRSGRVKPSEINKTKQTLKRESNALKSETPEQLSDPNYLQAQKEFYQGKADSLYKKKSAGTISGNESAELVTYERLAKGYQNKLEALDERIIGQNREFQGLNEAQDLASVQAAKQMSADTPNIVERVVGSVPFINRWLPLSGAKNVALEIAERGRSLPSRTAKIESLMKVANRDKSIAKMLKGESKPNLPKNPLSNKRGAIGSPSPGRDVNLVKMQDYVDSMKRDLTNPNLGKDEINRLKSEIAKHEAILRKARSNG